ncbi:MAG: 50S ribosomal protein L2 [Planctomycetes bacterium]|nr:50S ribosomal protein L2 [Planctomycetota bacterium]
MGIRIHRPTSAGRRNSSASDFADVTRSTPERSLLETLPRSAGRNHHGHITSRRRGNGVKRRYRVIDWRRDKDGMVARVDSVEYDPNRSARIALLVYTDGEKRYMLAPRDIKVGQEVMSGPAAEPRTGNCKALKDIPVGLFVHGVELAPGRGAQMGRSAGAQIQYAGRDNGYAQLVLPSGEMRLVPEDCRAVIGQVGNVEWNLIRWGKAGRMRHRGRRPKVRGSAMNPYSHPHGGGEGRTGAGRPPVSPWGKLAKGGKTRDRKKSSGQLILRRRTK